MQNLRQIVLRTLVLVAIIAVLDPLVFRYYGLPFSVPRQIAFAAINFVVLLPLVWFSAWLSKRRETWDTATSRRFKVLMLVLALLFLALAAFIFFHR